MKPGMKDAQELSSVGILGGSFDPIHYGHLALAEEARVALGLDQVLILPTAYQPLKGGAHAASPLQRLHMAELACRTNPAFMPSAIEIERSGLSYTIDTLQVLRTQYSGILYFILGADALMDLPRWRAIEHILQIAHIIAVRRPGTDLDLDTLKSNLPDLEPRLTLLDGPHMHISSREIRRRVALGRPIRYLCPDAVVDYIVDQELYRADS